MKRITLISILATLLVFIYPINLVSSQTIERKTENQVIIGNDAVVAPRINLLKNPELKMTDGEFKGWRTYHTHKTQRVLVEPSSYIYDTSGKGKGLYLIGAGTWVNSIVSEGAKILIDGPDDHGEFVQSVDLKKGERYEYSTTFSDVGENEPYVNMIFDNLKHGQLISNSTKTNSLFLTAYSDMTTDVSFASTFGKRGFFTGFTATATFSNIKLINTDVTPPEAPEVTTFINTTVEEVNGKAEADTEVTIKNDVGEVLGTAETDGTGKFSVEVSRQALDSTIFITNHDCAGNISNSTQIKVAPLIMEKPTINSVTDQDTIITGTGEPNAIVIMKVGANNLTTEINSDGLWQITIPKQDAGTIIEVATDKSGILSDSVMIIVSDVTSPNAPLLEILRDTDTLLKGVGEKNITVSIILPNGDLLTGRTNSKGVFQIAIPQQPAGRGVLVKLIDDAGNEGEVSTVISQNNFTTISEQYAIHGRDISLKKSDIASSEKEEIFRLIHEKSMLSGWDIEGKKAISSEMIDLVATNLLATSEEGHYTATFKHGNMLHHTNITLSDNTILAFDGRPEALSFQTTEIRTDIVTIPRLATDWSLKVRDTRDNGDNWTITATVNGPLEVLGDHEAKKIHHGFSYNNGENEMKIIDNIAFPIYEGTSGKEEQHEISWRADQGIRLKTNLVGVKANAKYQTSITWMLYDTP